MSRSVARSFHTEASISLLKNVIAPWAVIAASAGLLQWHSISFWQRFTGEIGILWSLSLEAVSLWLWFGQYKSLATVASLLLISGPMYELCFPVATKFKTSQQIIMIHDLRLSQAKQRLQTTQESLESYLANSRERVGWGGRIDKAQTDLKKSQNEYSQLLQQTPEVISHFESLFVVSIQMLALIVIMLSQILAIWALRSPSPTPPPKINSPKNISKDISEQKIPKETSEENYFSKELLQDLSAPHISGIELEFLIAQIQAVIDQELSSDGITQAEWADTHGISEKSMSLIRHHVRRRQNGQETISRNVVIKLAQRLSLELQAREVADA